MLSSFGLGLRISHLPLEEVIGRIVCNTVRCVMCKISNLNDPLRKCHGVNMTMFITNSEKKT